MDILESICKKRAQKMYLLSESRNYNKDFKFNLEGTSDQLSKRGSRISF
jgi:hypothetical protein